MQAEFQNPTIPNITAGPNKHQLLIHLFDQSEFDSVVAHYKITNQAQISDLKTLKQDYGYLTEGVNQRRLLVQIDYTYNNCNKTLLGIGAKVVKALNEHKVKEVDLQFPAKFDPQTAGQVVNGFILENYQFDAKSKEDQKFNPITTINITNQNFDIKNWEFHFLVKCAEHTLFARQLGTTRANVATPQYILQLCKQIAQTTGVQLDYVEGEDLAKQGMNLIYNVGKGSVNRPIIANLTYNGNPDTKDMIAFIGKGIVFDSGGYNLKQQLIELMYMDKCGACNVLAAFKAIAELKLKVNLTCTLGLAENFVDADAYRPSDIIKSLNGLTVEIGNTDAEGRLALADAMTFTQNKYKGQIKQMIELSTLTGACMVALGLETGGLFGNDDTLKKNLFDISTRVNEQLWIMPITEEHRNAMKGEHSDLNNLGKTRFGGSSQAAAFLENFVDQGVQWVHVDIAGPAIKMQKTATGFGTRILIEYIRQISQN